VRHGWKETGRRHGQIGCGFQWGSCHGTGLAPLEETSKHGELILERLSKEIGRTEVYRSKHALGEIESYEYTGKTRGPIQGTKDPKQFADEAVARLTEAGHQVEASVISERRQGFRVYYQTMIAFRFTVPKGAEEQEVSEALLHGRGYGSKVFRIPSYTTMQERTVRELDQLLEGLRRQETAIRTAILYHYENPSKGVASKKKGPCVHYKQTIKRFNYRESKEYETVIQAACRTRAYSVLSSENREEVTCSRCLKRIAKMGEAA
jgi:hypothetical protein